MAKLTIFTGVVGAGKGYQSGLLVDKGAVKVSLADTLREIVYDILGYTPSDYEYFKAHTVLTTSIHGNSDFRAAKSFTGRELLQVVGSAIRKQDDNFFISAAKAKIIKLLSDGYDVVIDDCRYLNELKDFTNITGHKVEVIFCDFKSDRYQPNLSHESERLAQLYKETGYTDLEVIYKNYD